MATYDTGSVNSNTFAQFPTLEEGSRATEAYNNFARYHNRMIRHMEKDLTMGESRLAQAQNHLNLVPQLFAYMDEYTDYTESMRKARRASMKAQTHANTQARSVAGKVGRRQIGVRRYVARQSAVAMAELAAPDIESAWQQELELVDWYKNARLDNKAVSVGLQSPVGAAQMMGITNTLSTLAVGQAKRANALAYEEAYLDSRKVSTTDKLITGLAGAVSAYSQLSDNPFGLLGDK